MQQTDSNELQNQMQQRKKKQKKNYGGFYKMKTNWNCRHFALLCAVKTKLKLKPRPERKRKPKLRAKKAKTERKQTENVDFRAEAIQIVPGHLLPSKLTWILKPVSKSLKSLSVQKSLPT